MEHVGIREGVLWAPESTAGLTTGESLVRRKLTLSSHTVGSFRGEGG